MTEATDNFGTDPSGRWTQELSSASWDNTDFEYDLLTNVPNLLFRYSSAPPGDVEHEAQVTFLAVTATTATGPCVRADGAANDYYGVNYFDGTIEICRYVAATITTGRTTILQETPAVAFVATHWYSIRLSAEGGNGANVVLKLWIQDHGTTKPSDPGWIGVVGSPDHTFTDTDAARLDDSSVHLYAGIGGTNYEETDYDTRHDFFKQRTIADRSGGGAALTFNVYHQSRKILRL